MNINIKNMGAYTLSHEPYYKAHKTLLNIIKYN